MWFLVELSFIVNTNKCSSIKSGKFVKSHVSGQKVPVTKPAPIFLRGLAKSENTKFTFRK